MTIAVSTADAMPALPETPLAEVKPIRGTFDRANVTDKLRQFYGDAEIARMREHGVDSRMVFGINAYYMALVRGEELRDAECNVLLPAMPPSLPLQHLVVPVVAEAADKSGEKDPSNQIRYSPDALKGRILHKYGEIVLAYAALACSAHCRYCYRLDLFNGSTGKGLVKPEELRAYIVDYNNSLAEGGERYPVTEVLLSGGDPMVLSNKQLYKYLSAAAEAGVQIVRIGTKEMAFRPMRFDQNLAQTLRLFHERYPQVHINIVTHFSHPDEFLERDAQGAYRRENGQHVWLAPVAAALAQMTALPFVSLDNQTPMIRGVNDDVASLRLLHREIRRGGIKPKYIFQCREIEGHKAFAMPVEEAWRIHGESQRGLSDACRSRFVMSTEWGKLEIVSVIDALPAALLETLPEELTAAALHIFGEGLVIFKMHRSPHGAQAQGDLIIARRNPKALWLSDYEDRLVYDARQPAAAKYAPLAQALHAMLPADAIEQMGRILHMPEEEMQRMGQAG